MGVVLVPPSPPFPVLLSLLPLWRAVTSAAPAQLAARFAGQVRPSTRLLLVLPDFLSFFLSLLGEI